MGEPEIDFFESEQNPILASSSTTTDYKGVFSSPKRKIEDEEIEILLFDPISTDSYKEEVATLLNAPPLKKPHTIRETNENDDERQQDPRSDCTANTTHLTADELPFIDALTTSTRARETNESSLGREQTSHQISSLSVTAKPPKPPKPISIEKQLMQQRLEEAKKVLPPRLHTVWTNLIRSFDRELRRELENHILDKEFVELREQGTKRPYLLTTKETELIKHYRNNYPFSCLLLYAISIILDRPFSAVKRKWTKEMQIIRSSSRNSVQKAIKRHCSVLQEAFHSLPKTNVDDIFGPLSKRLLAIVQSNRSITPQDFTADEIKAELRHLRSKVESGQLIDFKSLLTLLEEPNFQVRSGTIWIPPEKLEHIRQIAKRKVNQQQEVSLHKCPWTNSNSSENFYQNVILRLVPISTPPKIIETPRGKMRIWEDISDGKGPFKIRCVNEVDDEAPPHLNWLRERLDCTSVSTDVWEFTAGCQCFGLCTEAALCTCAQEMDKKFPYDPTTGYLVPGWSPGRAIYECNSKCQCSSDCRNRVIQKGEKFLVEIFKTVDKGWGLRARERIPRGAFVCEYVGEVITSEEAERRSQVYDELGLSYLYDLDFDRSHEANFTVDATFYGNVSRFINHCCEPNLQNYQVWVDDPNPQKPRIALFAKRDIEPGEELSFDYKLDITTSENISTTKRLAAQSSQLTPKKKKTTAKSQECKCGARRCRGILFAK
jgi:histone-lysine N-methyltransferase SUV39H